MTQSLTLTQDQQDKIKAMMAAMPPGSPHIPQPLPINIDPPMHGIYRARMSQAKQGVGDHTSTTWVNRNLSGDRRGDAIDRNPLDLV